MNSPPTLFISHGSPMLALTESPARQFLEALGNSLPRPKAILMISAHWESDGAPAISFASHPETIHDFRGFPAALFGIDYPAPGAPELAGHATQLIRQAGFTVRRSAERGLDHGTWVPLRLMYPQADIPVTQLALIHGAGPAEHEKLGRAIAALREEGVLIVGSGSLTHNLGEFRGQALDAPVPLWVSDFADWMHTGLQEQQREALLDYRRQAPEGKRNHPTEEHLLPLFVAMGAAGDAARVERIHASYEYGVLAMDVYAFS